MNPLRQTLECPVCYLVRRGEVYQCKLGHSVCGSCFTKLPAQLCPLARCGYDRPPRHNLMAEQIIAGGGVALDCENADHGCLFKGVGEEQTGHLPECLFREVPCPVTDCQVRVRLSELAGHIATSPDHVVEEGGSYWLELLDRSFEARNADCQSMEQLVFGKTFYEQVVVREGTYYAWVKVVGGAREAARCTCDVTAGGIDDITAMTVKNRQVHPIDRTVEEVLESGQYLSFTMQQARSIDELCIHVDCEIKMKKE